MGSSRHSAGRASEVEPHMRRAPIRVLVADDHRAVRDGLIAVLHDEPDMEVVGAATDGESTLQLARELRPDVLVSDLSMPSPGGLEIIRVLSSAMPEVRVVVFSLGAHLRFAAMRAGAAAFVSKEARHNELIDAVRRAATARLLADRG